MDYRPRKLSGLAITGFLLYTGFVIWTVLSHNPYLYSHFELKSKLSEASDWVHKPVPNRDGDTKWAAPLTYTSEMQQEGKEKNDVRESTWEEWSRAAVNLPNFQMQGFIYDEELFYVYSKDRIVAVDVEGQIHWQFKVLDEYGELYKPDVDAKMIYFAQSHGSVTALDRKTGQMLWWNEVGADILQPPVFVGEQIWLLTKSTKTVNPKVQNLTYDVVSILRGTGAVTADKRSFDAKTVNYWKWSDALEQLIVVSDARLNSFGKDMTPIWNQNLGASILASPTIIGNSIYVATKIARFFKLDAKRKGRVEWESDVEGVASTSAFFVPLVNGIILGTDDSYWHYYENKNGQRKWKIKLDNSQPFKEGWPMRISVKHYEEFKLHWPHKGWAVWLPCGSESICVVHPEKGNLLMRQSVGGAMDSMPRFTRFIALPVKSKSGIDVRQWVGPIEKKKLLKEKAVKEGKELPKEEPKAAETAQ